MEFEALISLHLMPGHKLIAVSFIFALYCSVLYSIYILCCVCHICSGCLSLLGMPVTFNVCICNYTQHVDKFVNIFVSSLQDYSLLIFNNYIYFNIFYQIMFILNCKYLNRLLNAHHY